MLLPIQLEIDTASQTQFAMDLNATDDCVTTGTNFDFDCDGDTIPDCCVLQVPVLGSSVRNWNRWSFADTPSDYHHIDSDL